MKKIVYVLLMLIVCFSFASNVFAEEFSVSVVNNNPVVTKGSDVSFKINVKSSEIIAECLFKFEADSNLEFVSTSMVNGWQVQSGSKGTLLSNPNLGTNSLAGGANILELKYKVNGDGRVVVKTLECVSLDEKTYTYDDIGVSFTVEEKEKDTSISNISVTNGSIQNVGATQYTVNLVSPTFGMTITTRDPEYQNYVVVKDSSGNVIKDLNNITFNDPSGQGTMLLTVTVNNTTTYDVFVKYGDKEYDNSLKSLTINGKNIDLVEGKYNYVYTVSKDVSNVEIEPVLNDPDNFKLAGNYSGKHSFSDNVIYLVIDVMPKDSSSGAKKVTYQIEVKREGTTNPGSGNNNGNSGTNTGNNNKPNVDKNPTTADVPMYLMGFILIASLMGSIVLYQKNLQSYK